MWRAWQWNNLAKKISFLRLHCRKFKLQTCRIPFHFLYSFKSVIHSFDPLIGCYILYSGFRSACTQLEIDDFMSQEVWKMTLSKEFGWIFTSWLLVMLWKRRRDIIQFFTSLGWNLFSKVLMQHYQRFTFFIRNVIFLKSRLTSRTTDFGPWKL